MTAKSDPPRPAVPLLTDPNLADIKTSTEPPISASVSNAQIPSADVSGNQVAFDPDDPMVGTIIADRYRMIQRVGEGGMGAVYRGEHVALRKSVAVKFLHAELSRIPDVVARFEREALAAAHLEHPNVVAAHD